jgi:pyruvate formate lyase activating enzyme
LKQGMVFDIQRFAVHDGPGIRTLVFLKGCPLSCAWCENPESQSLQPQLLFHPGRCIGCGTCVAECPNGALSMQGESLRCDRGLCRNCLRCVRVCPSRAREQCGELKTVEEVLAIVRKDKSFYVKSGGGVTLSGGEPLQQAEFATALLEAFKAENIHTALETCGLWSWSSFESLLPFLDLVLFDVKHIDPAEHQRGTLISNERILQNLRTISERGKQVIARLPIIPGFNDGEDIAARTADWLRQSKSVCIVHILPYHELGVHKYRLLGRPDPLPGTLRPSEVQLNRIREVYEAAGLKTVFEG